MNFSQYTTKTIDKIFSDLGTSEIGLSQDDVQMRLKKYGLNQIKSKKTTLFDIFLRQIKSPFVYLLVIATIVAFIVGERVDGLVILGFVFINVILGLIQEARAERAIALLKKYLPSKTRVMRNGKEEIVDKTLLVPGDILLLEQGNIVPADLYIFKVENCQVDESVLTGESSTVYKTPGPLDKEAKEIFEAKNIIFAGTSITSGEAEGVVINTGQNAVLGEVAKLVSTIARESAYEKNLLKFSRLIMKVIVITIIFIFLVNLAIKGTTNIINFSVFCIALTVGIIPEALPLVAVFSLSNGALKLAKEKVVVRRLAAVEDLGNIEILCSDKTGTLTEGKMVLDKVFSINKEKCIDYALLSSAYIGEEIESSLNPFDEAILTHLDGRSRSALDGFKSIEEIPFTPERLMNSVLVKNDSGEKILIVKGAPEAILKLSAKFEDSLTIEKLEAQIKKEGSEGKRILAVGYKNFDKDSYGEEDEKNLNFLGYFSFYDPLKPTAKKSVQLAKKLGVKLKIVTGDSKEVAGFIAKEIGLAKSITEVISGEELESLSEDEFKAACKDYSVFARISPQMKYNIVETLSKTNEVGFLGEGINDAPALKAAHVGLVVDSAADVSREVADIVLTEKDLNVVINGIKNGRNIFSNINKYIKITLASNFGNFMSVAIISLMIPYLPMLPIQILLINLLSDFPMISIASDSVDVEELRKPKYFQLNKVIALIVFLGLVSTLFDFLFFGIFHKTGEANLQTLWYIESILTEIILVFCLRTSHFFLKGKRPSFPLSIIALVMICVTILLPFTGFGRAAFHFIRPDWNSLFIVFALVLSYFVLSEIAKLYYFRRTAKRRI